MWAKYGNFSDLLLSPPPLGELCRGFEGAINYTIFKLHTFCRNHYSLRI